MNLKVKILGVVEQGKEEEKGRFEGIISGFLSRVKEEVIKKSEEVLSEELKKGRVGKMLEKLKSESVKMEGEDGNRELFKFGVVADSHEDTIFFPQVLERLKKDKVEFIIHLGDLSNAGDMEVLREAKQILDRSDLTYYVIPGDHDLNWSPNHDKSNFQEIFGSSTYTSFSFKQVEFLLVDNTDHQEGLGEIQWSWLQAELEKLAVERPQLIFAFTHSPLFSPYFPQKVMGQQNEEVSKQKEELLVLFEDLKVDQIFSGDVHTFARYPDSKTGLQITTVGAAGKYKNPLPQYVLVTVFEDYGFIIEAKAYRGVE